MDVARLGSFVVALREDHLPAITAARAALFGDHKPVDTLLGVDKLAHPGCLLEVDVIAVIGRRAPSAATEDDSASRSACAIPCTRDRDVHSGRDDLAVTVRLAVRAGLDDGELSRLHALAFGGPLQMRAWRRQLAAHSLTWVTAHEDDGLVGFVNVAWDGGAHAFLLDTVVRPDRQHDGLGTALVRRAAAEAAAAGCEWLHVDFEDLLGGFYLDACGFPSTAAGLVRLRNRA